MSHWKGILGYMGIGKIIKGIRDIFPKPLKGYGILEGPGRIFSDTSIHIFVIFFFFFFFFHLLLILCRSDE